jgi:WbqC-like protein family
VISPKSIAILQSNYIPWKGYFDIIAAVDEFVIFDEVQFTRGDWRNRNRIVRSGISRWLTIPVRTSGRSRAPISTIETADPIWTQRHLSYLQQSYDRARHFRWLHPYLVDLYRRAEGMTRLTDINELFLRGLLELIELPTRLTRGEEVPRMATTANGRLIEICQAKGASIYVTGPAAKAYIDPEQFAEAGIALLYANYAGYPPYEQGTEAFDNHVSLVDTLYRCGPETRGHLKSLRDRSSFLDKA